MTLFTVIASELPSPPALERWFLEQPLPAVVGLLAIGGVALFSANRRAELRKGVYVLGACVVAACGVFALATLVTTPREQASARTAEMIDRVLASDVDAVEGIVDDALVVASAGEVIDNFSRDELLGVVAGIRFFAVGDWNSKARGATLDGPNVARTQSTVRAITPDTSLPMASTWEFTWRLESSRSWTLTRLECLSINGQSPGVNWARYAQSRARPRSERNRGLDEVSMPNPRNRR